MSEQQNNQPAAPTKSCANCRFSVFIMGQPTRECRRSPPQMFPVQTQMGHGFMNQWPQVKPNLWCGEFQPKLQS